MKKEYDFSKGKRGAIITEEKYKSKSYLTIKCPHCDKNLKIYLKRIISNGRVVGFLDDVSIITCPFCSKGFDRNEV